MSATLTPPNAPRRARVASSLRSSRNWVQLAQFCTVGAVGYAINLAVYTSILHQGVHYLAAATCSFLVAVTSNYALNRHWTFRDRRAGVAAQGMRFFAVSLGAGKLAAQAAAIVIVTPLNFVGNKLWSFRRT